MQYGGKHEVVGQSSPHREATIKAIPITCSIDQTNHIFLEDCIVIQ